MYSFHSSMPCKANLQATDRIDTTVHKWTATPEEVEQMLAGYSGKVHNGQDKRKGEDSLQYKLDRIKQAQRIKLHKRGEPKKVWGQR